MSASKVIPLTKETIQVLLKGTRSDGFIKPTDIPKLAKAFFKRDVSSGSKPGQKLKAKGLLEHRDGNQTDLFVTEEIMRFMAEIQTRTPEEETHREPIGSAGGEAAGGESGWQKVSKKKEQLPERNEKQIPELAHNQDLNDDGAHLVPKVVESLKKLSGGIRITSFAIQETHKNHLQALEDAGFSGKYALYEFLYKFHITVKTVESDRNGPGDKLKDVFILNEKYQNINSGAAKKVQRVTTPQDPFKKGAGDFVSGAPNTWASKVSGGKSFLPPETFEANGQPSAKATSASSPEDREGALQKAQEKRKDLLQKIALTELVLETEELEAILAALMVKRKNKP